MPQKPPDDKTARIEELRYKVIDYYLSGQMKLYARAFLELQALLHPDAEVDRGVQYWIDRDKDEDKEA